MALTLDGSTMLPSLGGSGTAGGIGAGAIGGGLLGLIAGAMLGRGGLCGWGGGYGGYGYGGFGGFGGQQRQSTYEDEESVRRRAAANFVQSGHYQEAMNVLNSLSQKNGEWYYISSMANMGMGNNVKALEHIREAVRQEPNNQQYRMLLNRMEGGGSWYETQQGPFGGMPAAGDDMCLKLCLANALCGMCCPGGGVLCC